ncbi:glutathione S-transferase [Beggiatoa alba]|nr:glutathione S-transferase [Beggiatoa alba]
MTALPILYSFRRCPYAIRARMALLESGVSVELREVDLNVKPAEMLAASPKATVPVMLLPDYQVIDESIEIMKWALSRKDSNAWISTYSDKQREQMERLIKENDTQFKQHLDHYKYAARFPAFSPEHYRQQGTLFLDKLEQRLLNSRYLFGQQLAFADIAIFPFIRQFAHVDQDWFYQTRSTQLQDWLNGFLDSEQFASVMRKFPVWQAGDVALVFGTEVK